MGSPRVARKGVVDDLEIPSGAGSGVFVAGSASPLWKVRVRREIGLGVGPRREDFGLGGAGAWLGRQEGQPGVRSDRGIVAHESEALGSCLSH